MENNKHKVCVYFWTIGDTKSKDEINLCKERANIVINRFKLVEDSSQIAFQDLSDFKHRPLKDRLISVISKKNKTFKWPLIEIYDEDVYVCSF